MNIIRKIYNYFYITYLRIFYYKNVYIKGKIKSKNFLKFEIGKNSFLEIEGDLDLKENVLIAVRKNASLYIGKNCFFNRGCSIVAREKIYIDNECMFGEDVKIYDNNHKILESNIFRDEYETEMIFIGENCWIANNVNILKGSKIPSKSVVAAMSLVNKALQVSGIYAGIPVQLKKEIK